jgi:type I restriction-modification system DNA methylase subunit
MSKIKGELNYRDWCIIKHALRDKVNEKEFRLQTDKYLLKKGCQDFTQEKLDKSYKELSEEKKALERVTKLINEFKEDWE